MGATREVENINVEIFKKGDIILHANCPGMEYHFDRMLRGQALCRGWLEPMHIYQGEFWLSPNFGGYKLKSGERG